MLVYEMMTGLPPWYTTDRSKLFRRLKSAPLDIPSYFSQQAASCVSALLERNPRRRLGVTGIRTAMENDFFRSINWRALYGKRVEAPIRPCEGWKAPEAMNGDVHEHPLHAEMIGSDDLDAATSNFDSTFTRMPVETDDSSHDAQHSDESDLEELCADTFVGFTFDEADHDGSQSAAAATARQRTHHFQQQQHE
jgi:serine/threonine protein kinase